MIVLIDAYSNDVTDCKAVIMMIDCIELDVDDKYMLEGNRQLIPGTRPLLLITQDVPFLA